MSSSVVAYSIFKELHARHILLCLGLDPSLVFRLVVDEQVVGLRLCRTARIWFIQEILNSDQDLFQGNCGPPSFFLIENRQTNGT
jgi:hypothetical protein